jgi:mitochondrial fission protein ELM1
VVVEVVGDIGGFLARNKLGLPLRQRGQPLMVRAAGEAGIPAQKPRAAAMQAQIGLIQIKPPRLPTSHFAMCFALRWPCIARATSETAPCSEKN